MASCTFGDTCKPTCPNYTICALIRTEQHLNSLEEKVGTVFENIGDLTSFCAVTGENVLSIKEQTSNMKSLAKNENIKEYFDELRKDFSVLAELIALSQKQIEETLTDYGQQFTLLSDRLKAIEENLSQEAKPKS